MRLPKCQDPKCPECGCQQSKILRRYSRWGDPFDNRECEACGNDWHEPAVEETQTEQPKPVYWDPTAQCAKCNSWNTFVTSKRILHRWHKCRDCSHRFLTFSKKK